MSLVLMTHIGFVASVEQAPAVIEADIRESHLFSEKPCQPHHAVPGYLDIPIRV